MKVIHSRCRKLFARPRCKQRPRPAAFERVFRMESDVAHFEMLTFWDNVDAIKRFAGEDFQLEKYYDFDPMFLVELEPNVRHYTVYND